MRPSSLTISLVLTVTLTRAVGAQSGGVVEATRPATTLDRIHVDGVLDEPVWAQAEAIPLPFEVFPGNNAPAGFSTDCRMARNDVALFVACVAHDPDPDQIRSRRTLRDQIEGDDRIVLLLDTFADQRRGWEFAVNAVGAQADGVVQGFSPTDLGWDAIWESAGRIDARGYVVEFAIPFKSLRFARDERRTWRFVVTRHRPRQAPVTVRSHPLDQSNTCQLCQLAPVEGLSNAGASLYSELIPTITTRRRSHTPGSGDATAGTDTEVGVDARVSLGAATNISVTVNPDFSQVESDGLRTNAANTTFAIGYPERRPFFLEGADLFVTPVEAFFTRRLVDPAWGVKLTSKAGKDALGAMVVRDARTEALIPGHEESSIVEIPGGSTGAALRYRRDVGTSSSLGVLATSRSGTDYSNLVGGLDVSARPHPSITVTAHGLRSMTRYPVTSRERTGHAAPIGSMFGIATAVSTRDYVLELSATRATRGFRSDMGFEPQVGVTELDVAGDRILWGREGGLFSRFSIGAGQYRSPHDTTPAYANRWRFIRLSWHGPRQLLVRAYFRHRQEGFRDRRFSFYTQWFSATAQPSRWLDLLYSGTVGEAVDYDVARAGPSMEYNTRAVLHLRRDVDAAIRVAGLAVRTSSDTSKRTRVVEAQLAWAPTSRSSVRALWQRSTTDRARAADHQRARRTGLQWIASYRLDAQTAVLVGYGSLEDATSDDALRSSLPVPRSTLLYAKLSLAWRP